MYEIRYSKSYRKSIKRLIKNEEDLYTINSVINSIASGHLLESRYRDHKLSGKFDGFRECHIKNDLLLIYKKYEKVLILVVVNIGSHSELFG